MSIPSRHPEVAEPQPNRSMQNLNCHPEFISGSINAVPQGEKSSLDREDLGGCLSFNADKIETHPLPLPIHGGEKKAAFTLAEVLITLAIIGVVAAMTIPTLIFNYNKKVIETRLARFYSIMNNAVALSEVDNGPKTSWNFVLEEKDENGDYINQLSKTSNFVDKYLLPYLKVVKVENSVFNTLDVSVYYLTDGSAFCITSVDSHHIYFFPQNVKKCLEKNVDGRGICHFPFAFLPAQTLQYNHKYHFNKGIEPYKFAWDGNTETFLTGSRYSCDSNGMYCTALIQANGWKIPDNYPKSLR